MITTVIFIICLAAASFLFTKNVRTIIRNINLGRDIDRTDQQDVRWKTMLKVAMGQSKMVKRPIAGLLHIVVYVGFLVINLEVLEIVIDGIFDSHRSFSFLGSFYTILIATFEVLALLTWIACAIFLVRRNVLKVKRFWSKEMTSWPRNDANIILVTEIALMTAFLLMNAADAVVMGAGGNSHVSEAAFPISSLLTELLPTDLATLGMIERSCWWFHILGIFAFLNYLPYSKHFHIILAFPNVFYSNLKNKGEFNNLESVKNEVSMMMDPSVDPYAAPAEADPSAVPIKFGAKDVTDLSWKQLMDAYACTECGRCTSECPANQTGKLLSPRKIVMDTRDRLVEYGKNLDKNGTDAKDGKSLLHDYITPEELWACTSCNACTNACPVNIDPLSTIIDLRRYLVMEESAASPELNGMFTNVENNGAPWQFSPMDRFNWASEE